MWKAPVLNTDLRIKIADKIEEIADILLDPKVISSQTTGLLTGQGGLILFYNYYWHYKNLNNPEKNEELILNLFNDPDKIKGNSLCSGWSGLLNMLTTLRKDNLIEMDDSLFEDTLEMTNNHLITFSKNNNYDYLHGSFGVFTYLLEHPNLVDQKLISDWLAMFKNANENTNDMLLRKTLVNVVKNETGYCLGLAHGTPSIILILIKYLKLFQSPIANEILLKSIKYLQSTRFQDKENKRSIFPSTIVDGQSYESQLSWCYGDLGCAYALYEAGKFMSDQILIDDALNIALHSTKRNGPKEVIRDADFCHGTVGIAHFYSRFYNYTGIEDFRIASEYWYNQTLLRATFSDGLAGFKHYLSGEYANRYCLLEGISGIGLSFISSITDKEPNWDNPMLLSN